jgi:recombination protein RecA
MRLGQGRENAKQFLRENPSLADEISNRIRVEAGLIEEPASESGAEAVAEEATVT